MDPDLEHAEQAAMRVQWGRFPGAVVQRVGALEVFAAPGPDWRRQIRGLTPDTGPAELARAVAVVPDARIPVVEGAASAALERCGYRPGPVLLRLSTPAEAEPPRQRVEVAGPEDAALVEELAGTGFGLDLPGWWSAPLGAPGWTQVVAFEGERAVATGALHVAAGTGWVGAAATLPGWRGRGAQRALLACRLRLAREQGATRVCVKASPGSASHRNLLRAGFAEVYALREWVPG